MNFNRFNIILAREWLIFLIAVLIGIIFTVVIYFYDSSEYLKQRENLYKSLNDDFEYHLFYNPHHIEYPKSFMSYLDFSKVMDDNSRRKTFFDSINQNYDGYRGNYTDFEERVVSPKFYSGFLKLYVNLFSRSYWLATIFLLLLPYLVFQFIRSIYFSIKTLVKT